MMSRTAHTDVQSPSRRIAGWMPAGMLDWQGRLTTTLFLTGCSLRCPFCHNPGLLGSADRDTDWASFESYLSQKRDWLDGVVITGGEPTDDPAIGDLLERITALGYEIKLDTNGTNPDTLETLLSAGLIRHVALDIKTTAERYDTLVGRRGSSMRVRRTIDLLQASGVSHEYRTTAYPGAISIDDLPVIAETLAGGSLYAIQQFVPDRTLDPRAGTVLPFRPDALHEAAALCSRHLPTIVRGA